MTTFADTGLSTEILKALDDLGFTNPTAIQEKTIPHLLSSQKDLIALAQTGTGKTAAFSLPIVQQVNPDSRTVQAIILCPTRELCLQITKDIQSFSTYKKGIVVTPVYGGERIEIQLRALSKGAQIIVGTPGRVRDMIRRRKLNISKIKWLVLDEADEMLNMGFTEDLDAILSETPQQKQTLLFSATMEGSVERIAKKYMQAAEELSVSKRNSGNEDVTHQYYMVHAKDRYEALRRIADMTPDIYGIVFCRTRRETKEVADKLIADHYSADALHGDISQDQREYVMNRFRKKKIQLLVATDVAARGIDVNNLTHVINYNLPDALEAYIHRSGRTGRARSKGISLSLIHMKEVGKIRAIERKVGRPFEQVQVPLGKDICEKQLFHLIDTVKKIKVDEKKIGQYLPQIYKKLESLSREELIQHIVSTEFNRFLELYKDAPDLNVHLRGSGYEKGRNGGGKEARHFSQKRENIRFAGFQINFGAKHKFTAKHVLMLINKQQRLKGVEIGKIRIGESSSFFEIDERYGQALMKCFQRQYMEGRPLVIKPSR